MLLTKKGLLKIILMTGAYFVLGSICMVMAIVYAALQLETNILYLGILIYLLCFVVALWGRYAQGKLKWISLGNKLVMQQLKPAEFLKQYHDLTSSADLVVNKPSADLLQFVIIAYDSLDDRENCIAAADQMIAVAGKKQKLLAMISKASVLFSYDKTEEAEALFDQIHAAKKDLVGQNLTDVLRRSDRAIAMGDYKTAEDYNLQMLEQKFPKQNPLTTLVCHFSLGKIYERMDQPQKAITHYEYCAEHGGQTAMKESARAALERLQSERR